MHTEGRGSAVGCQSDALWGADIQIVGDECLGVIYASGSQSISRVTQNYTSVSPTNFITFLCLGLQQIRDHFYYINGGHLYSKSGLGFAVTLSILKLGNLWGHTELFLCAP